MKRYSLITSLFLSIAAALFAFNSEEKNKLAYTSSAFADCTSTKGIAKVICLADAFKATLSAEQIAIVQLPYTLENAQTWSNFPSSMFKRLGIKMGDLNATQLAAAKSLLKEINGTQTNEGWDEVQMVWQADDYLNTKQPDGLYGAGNYYIAFFGTPAMTGTFEIMTTGHHMTVANTYTNGVLVGATPRFEAVEPFEIPVNGTLLSPINQEREAFAAMLTSLTEEQREIAKSPDVRRDLVLTPQKNWMFPTTYTGLPCKNLSAKQKKLVINAIKTYTSDVADADAKTILAKYTSELNETYITYSGTTALATRGDYARIDGPHVWIELSVQRGAVLRDEAFHVHSVWRDRVSDYGGTH